MVGIEPIHVPPDADAETMEKLRLQLETTLNDATRRAYAPVGRPEGRSWLTPLPMTLRVYRKLSVRDGAAGAGADQAAAEAGQGRSGARRRAPRHERRTSGPHGPLVWIHGASVGEVLAAAALIEKLRALNLRILLTSGTVTSAAIVAKRFPPDVIHQYVPYDSPRYVARFLDHWRPSLALFIESDLWPNLILSSAARRLPMVLINGRMSHRSFPRWRRVSRHDLGAARPVRHLPRAVARSMPSAFRRSAAATSSPPAISSSTCRRRRPTPPSWSG